MAYVRFTNLTPLTVNVRATGAAGVLAVLKPCEETTAKMPKGTQFDATDMLDNYTVTSGLSARNETQHLQITDDAIRSKASAATQPISAMLINTLPYAVTVSRVESDGRESHPDQIGSREVRNWPAVPAGLAFRARKGGSGEKLDTIVLAPRQFMGQVQVFPIADRYQVLRRLADNEPSLTLGRYDIVKADLPPPDPTDTKYIRYGHQTIGSWELNGWKRPVRRVTISGVDLIFDGADRSRFLATYAGAEDIGELWIHADTVVIKAALRFPGTNVHVYCRALQFQGAESCIDTTPIDKPYRDPTRIDGEAGAKAGDIVLYTSYFHTDQKQATHLRARGARGQDPDEGGVDPSISVRHLQPISEEQWKDFFKHDNRRLPHEEVLGDKWGYTSVAPFPDFKQHIKSYPNFVYIEVGNRYYTTQFHDRVSEREILHAWGTKDEPGKGGKGRRPGCPGLGGTGGRLTCSLAQIKPYADLTGGRSGTPLRHTPGGAGGTPAQVHWLFFDGVPDGANHRVTSRLERKTALPGDESEPGPRPKSESGDAGSCVLDDAKRHAWITAVNFNVALQFARDACASGHADYAKGLLVPYVTALADLSLEAELEQPLREARELVMLAAQNADYFGKPPGWVPTLALESAAGIYDSLLPRAMEELYSAYYIEKIAQSRQDKQAALKNLAKLIGENTETAKTDLVKLRKRLPTAMGDLKQLLLEMEDVSRQLAARERALRDQADREAVSQEQKEAAAAAFKIAGAVVKAIPLPEPFQSAASAFGAVLDITGGFIDDGAADKAFENLKTQVTAFTDDGQDSLTEYLNADLDGSLDVRTLEKDAAAARRDKEALEANYGEQAKQLEALKEKRKEVYEAKKEALLYSRAATLEQRSGIVKKTGKLTTNYQADAATLEAATNDKVAAYQAAQRKVDGVESEIAAKKAEFERDSEAREKEKAANAKAVKTRMKQVRNVADSVASIAATINKLAVSKSQLDSKFDQALARLEHKDSEFTNLAQRIKFLGEKKATVAKTVVQLVADIASRTNKISTNMLALNEFAAQMATNNESLDPNALVYIQSIGQDAHATLTKFLYYTVKAYEYYMVAPSAQAYVSAQKLFDDLRRVLEPSSFRLDAATDPQGDKQKRLEAILSTPDPRNGGMLSASDFALLKMVYERPILEMGKRLATELMESGGSALRETRGAVTLTADWLADLNERIQSDDKLNQVIFNLVDLRQIAQSVEKQRISNIKVIAVQATRLGRRFPDSIKFIFEHVGKSIVRARGRLFAFEPQSTANDEHGSAPAVDLAGSGVVFETQGGKSAALPKAWNEQVVDGKTNGGLESASLWQPDRAPQENLLSKLLKNSATLSLSQFRPGAFSDFLFRVEINPPESKITLTEIVLEVSFEGGSTSNGEILVCVNNNLGLEIPVSTAVKDMSGRGGGVGRYVGVFNTKKMASAGQRNVRVSVPPEYGQYALQSWQIDGETLHTGNPYCDAAKDAYIVANYERKAGA